MRTFTNRIIGLVLALAMIASFVLVPSPMDIEAEAATVSSTTLCDYVQDGATLQCWNWSIANIKANLGLIANMGYSAIQVSPMQEMKEGTVNKPYNNWWAVYQPISFYINESNSHCVGTKDELIDLCTEAHKYDIKVIMDVVFNHTANNGENQLCPLVDPDFLNDPSCWHDYSQNSSSYNDRYDVTQRCMAGLPDLNTGYQLVQDKALALMKEYIDCGVDGFRFDAAKQIETPEDDASFASDFWPTVVNGASDYASSTRGIMLYFYGELLQDTDNYGSLPISAYTKYMSATESVWSNDVRYKLEDHSAAALQKAYFKDANADKLVLWAESHDTVGDQSSIYSTQSTLDKAWALVGSRAYTMALYFPRCLDVTGIPSTSGRAVKQEMGEMVKIGWNTEFTKAVNRFHNHFVGQSEYLTQDTTANLYYNERGNSGIVIVNFNDGGRDINLPVYAMAAGTYYDQITGNQFTVSGGRIYGTMGDTGVAVVYNPSTTSCSHASHGLDGYCYDCYTYVGHSSGTSCSVCGTASTRTIYFNNNESWSTPYIYGWHETAGEATASWPGNAMTLVEGNIYSAEIPATATNIIFNDNNGTQTENLVPSADNDTYDCATGFWSTRGQVELADNYYLFYTTNSDAYNGYDYRFVDGKLSMTFSEDSYVWLIDSNGVQYMCDGWPGAVTSVTLKTLDSMSNSPDKLPVPAGVALTFTMVANTDGTISLSYAEGGDSSGGTTGGGTTTTTKTIYFDCGSSWTKANVYAWNADGAVTGEWPGTAMTSLGNGVYSYDVPTTATSIIFNDGTNQTSDLTIPSSGNLYTLSTNAWSTYSSGGSTGGSGSTGGDVTGGNVPDNTYYLFWGNSSGSLSHNEWDTPFVDGKLTVTFNETMYVWVITNVDGTQYMTDGWQGEVNSVKLYKQPTLTNPNKLMVPAGTQTLTLSDNGDGSLTLAYGDGNSGNTGGSTGGDSGSTTSTKTIYFDNSSKNWSKVNVYAWNADGALTGEWPGSAMTSIGNNIYSYEVPTTATSIIFNDGTNQTDDLTIPTDGKNQCDGSSWSTYSSGGSTGGDSGSTGGDVTGGNVPDNTYYLFWGNSSGSLSHNEWDTPFVDGKLTVTFDETMYVWVITNVDGTQYMTDGWQGEVNSVKLYKQPTLTEPNKLMVPAGTQTLTLSDNGDGSLTLAYGDGNSGNTGGSTGGDSGSTTTTTTIYYDNSSTNWSSVNAYTWDAAGTAQTGSWPGSAMTLVEGNIYSIEVPSTAVNIIFNDGTSQTDDLTIPTDGTNLYNGSAWSTYSSGGSTGGDTSTGEFRLVSDLSDVTSGGQFIIAVKNGDTYRAMGDTMSGSSIPAADVTVNGDVASGAPVITLKPADGGVIANANGSDVTFGTSGILVVAKGTDGFTFTSLDVPTYGILYNSSTDVFTITLTSYASYSNYMDEALLFKYVEDGAAECTHSYTSSVTTAATCTTAGVKTYTCSSCGDSYTESIAATGHSYTSKVTAPTCTAAGYTTYTCGTCGDSYTDNATAATGHSYTSSVTTAATCTTAGVKTYTCSNCGDTYTESIAATGHSYANGTCTVCGESDGTVTPTTVTIYFDAAGTGWSNVNVYTWDANGSATTGQWPGSAMTLVEGTIYSYEVPLDAVNIIFNNGSSQTDDLTIPTDGKNLYTYSTSSWSTYGTGGEVVDPVDTTYYLVGYINGANYGCDEDYENMGEYKFVDGKLTATFNQDSYIFVKTEGNGKWFLANAYCTDTTCTFVEGGTEKMLVPGNTALTFTLTENADGSVTVSYTTAAASTVPTLKLSFPTLTFEDMISMNVYFTATDITDVVEMGMIAYSSQVTDYGIDTAEKVVPGYTWSDTYQMYVITTGAIAAKDMSDTIYFAAYAKLADGTYAYSALVSYSPTSYAYDQLSSGTDDLKNLMIAMLNYGAEAQTFFNYRTDALMNASLTADQKASIESYRADMMDSVASVSTSKAANFTRTSTGFTSRYPSISFEGAFAINYYCVPSATVKGNITLYYWNQADFDAVSVLSTSNATGAITMTQGTDRYEAAVTGIAAKDLDKGIYVAFVYSDGTTSYCSGILGYSIGAYCVANAATTDAIAPFAAATAVYGYYAKQFFNV